MTRRISVMTESKRDAFVWVQCVHGGARGAGALPDSPQSHHSLCKEGPRASTSEICVNFLWSCSLEETSIIRKGGVSRFCDLGIVLGFSSALLPSSRLTLSGACPVCTGDSRTRHVTAGTCRPEDALALRHPNQGWSLQISFLRSTLVLLLFKMFSLRKKKKNTHPIEYPIQF